jgi:hypothetical protein
MTRAEELDQSGGTDTKPLEVAGKPADWKFYRDEVADFVPDPMVLRAADVFLMGKQRALDLPLDLPPNKRNVRIGRALDKNFQGILCFSIS